MIQTQNIHNVQIRKLTKGMIQITVRMVPFYNVLEDSQLLGDVETRGAPGEP